MASTPHHACLDCPTLVRATTRRCRPCEDRRRKAERCQYGFIDHTRVPCPEIGCTRLMSRQATRCRACAAAAGHRVSRPVGACLRFPPETRASWILFLWAHRLRTADLPQSSASVEPSAVQIVHRPSAVKYGQGGARTLP